MSVPESTAATVAAKSGDMSWWADTLTDIVRSSALAAVLPAVSVRAGLFEDPPSDLGDEAGLLGERYEQGRRHQPPGRVGPAQEGFDAGDPPVVGLDDRLVFRSQLTARGAAQVALQAGPLVGEVLLAQVDDLVAGTAFALRLVHRRVGVLEELLGELVAPTREGDTHAGRHLHLGARQDERCGDRGADAGRDHVDLLPARRGLRTG